MKIKTKKFIIFVLSTLIAISCKTNVYAPADSATHTQTLEERINTLAHEGRYDEAMELAKKLPPDRLRYVLLQFLRLIVLFRLRKIGITEKELEAVVNSKDPLENIKMMTRIGSVIKDKEVRFLKKQRDKLQGKTPEDEKMIKVVDVLLLASTMSKTVDKNNDFERKIATKNLQEEDIKMFKTSAESLAKMTPSSNNHAKEFVEKLNQTPDKEQRKALIDLLEKHAKKDKQTPAP